MSEFHCMFCDKPMEKPAILGGFDYATADVVVWCGEHTPPTLEEVDAHKKKTKEQTK